MKPVLVSRYHLLLVTLHWLLALLIVAMLGGGFLLVAKTSNTVPRKIGVLLIHAAAAELFRIIRLRGRISMVYLARLLVGLIVLHVLAALDHSCRRQAVPANAGRRGE